MNYSPSSYFFVDNTKLSDANIANWDTDAFGPQDVAESETYRTTSFVRSSELTKVFAVCNGQILIQPQTEDNTKVNLILKPDASESFYPLKIKYFIYRGVNKADLINGDNLQPENEADPNQPTFLKQIWKEFKIFNMPFFEKGIIEELPDTFPAFLIGYTEDEGTTSIEKYIRRTDSIEFYQLPYCKKGEHLGFFTGKIGLDIVLDYGDYELTNQEELFRLDLNFARKAEHVFDITTISDTTPTKVKRYKEYIHQFMDAAAFWGSHIDCGTIRTIDEHRGTSENVYIYNNILKKYQTKNKIYVYIQGERIRSYNYYDSTRKIYGFNSVGEFNNTAGWPILIQEITLPADTTTFKELKNIQLDYNVSNSIHQLERQIMIDVIAPNNNIISPKIQRPNASSGKTDQIKINFPVNGKKSCSIFLFLFGNLKQDFPIKDYFNELWQINLGSTLNLPSDNNLVHWITYDRNHVVNLDDVLNTGAVIQNHVVFDNGLNTEEMGPNLPTKRRRLYIASIKRNSTHDFEYNNYNINHLKSGFIKQIKTKEQYSQAIYNNPFYAVYKGLFRDTEEAIDVNSLSLVHENNFYRKNSFFHLGIIEEEFNKLIYDSPTVPEIIPPQTTITQYLPKDANNVFFHLEEVSTSMFASENIRKFKLGLQYEDNTGVVSSILYPSSENEVFVYTLDGFFFFSKEYTEYQEFFNEFANAIVEFRTVQTAAINPPVPAYNGEFGFDWLRIDDTPMDDRPTYQISINGGYKRPTMLQPEAEYPDDYGEHGYFYQAYKALKREYKSIPTKKINQQYFIPYLNLFSQQFSNSIHSSLPSSLSPPPFEAYLRVYVNIEEDINKLVFDYDTSLFTIDKPILSDNEQTDGKESSIDLTIKITCLQDFREPKQIRILAYPLGVDDKINSQLAGIIIVNKNDISTRKVADIVLVKTQTNADDNPITPFEKGVFTNEEKNNLANALYQSFIVPNIVEELLPLENNSDFKVEGKYIDSPEEGPYKGSYFIKYYESGLQTFLRNKFISLNPDFLNYFTIFSFGLYTKPNSEGNRVVGIVQDIGVHNVNLFNGRGDMTLCHEVLHGYGLYHTHKETYTSGGFVPIKEPEKKYTYPNANKLPSYDKGKATDNYMSYSGNNRKTIWYWQIHIVLMNLK